MEKIGILGGTFNPVHVEHVRLAKCAVEELGLDKLLVMPTFIPPHKQVVPAPAHDRIKMLELAFIDDEKIEVSDFEIEQGGKSYTYLTVEHFQKVGAQIYFIVGGDMLVNFKTWRFPERILKSARLAVFEREDFYADFEKEREYFREHFNADFIKLNYVGKNISSTKIRVYSAFSLSLEGLVPKKVEEYVNQSGLYGGDLYVDFVKTRMPEKRVKHTANVVISALKKAKELGLDEKKVMIAATLHDCAKYFDHTKIDGFTIDKDVPPPVIHQFLGAFVAEKFLGVFDKEILDAIRYHTSGKADMSLLGKLIFVADMVEEGRDYDGVEYLRALYEKDDFEFCFRECLREEMLHLINKGQKIYAETISAYDYYVEQKGEK
ncbi:MAG: nicotinate (nicotinamide) nucleotide adenylyltransferase [Clostridia bacterium]|nr:nicotinate (nicotinamide) nucleotide adenylyltransferase [Clostridia bacterium]